MRKKTKEKPSYFQLTKENDQYKDMDPDELDEHLYGPNDGFNIS